MAGPAAAPPVGPRVLLFNLPWVEPSHAPLGLGIVKRLLDEAGIGARCVHANLGFFRVLVDAFGLATAQRLYRAPEVGEVAAGLLYRRDDHDFDPPAEGALLSAVLRRYGVPERLFWDTVRHLDRFTTSAVGALDLQGVDAFGFTLCIRQTMPSLLWARALKKRAPALPVVFGGSTCEDPMGLALLESHDVLDYLCRGEADTSIVPLFRRALGEGPELDEVPNVAFRRDGAVVATAPRVVTMADTVRPDHTDFARAYPAVEALTGAPANFYLEASRGCWWGEKRHCVFCGIHTSAIEFRTKPAHRVLDEITDLLGRHRTFRFVLADTILAKEHFGELLPRLEALRAEHDLEYLLDVKSSLSKQDVYLLARSGCVALQLGIESLSDRLLRLMAKGNTALQQIQAIKWCAEVGIRPAYALLTHVAGEEPDDYDEMLGFARLMVHLPPPGAVAPIELDRYSPYFREWEARGFERPTPQPWYRLMFGPDGTDLESFAYHFDGVHPSTAAPGLAERRAELGSFVRDHWAPEHATTRLTYRAGRGWLRLVRRRGVDVETIDLEGAAAALYRACDKLRTGRELRDRFAEDLGPGGVDRALAEWREQGLLVQARGRDVHLALALDARSFRARADLPDADQSNDVAVRPPPRLLSVVAG